MKKPILIFILLLIILIGNAQTSIKPTSNYIFEYVDLENMPRMMFVEDIIMDNIGLMWFATREGLYRFDGINKKRFLPDPVDTFSLLSMQINNLCLDNDKKLWVATNNALHQYNELQENFSSYPFPVKQATSYTNNIMCHIFADTDGNIWVSTWDRGLLMFNIKTKTYKHYLQDLGSKTVRAVMQDHLNKKWIATHSGLFTFNAQKDSLEEFKQLKQQAPNNRFTQLNTIYEDEQGILWIGTNGGIIKFDRLSAQLFFKNLSPLVGDKNIVEAIHDDKKGNLWIGTRDGLYIFNKAALKVQKTIYSDKKSRNGLLSSDIRTLFDDEKGNLWIGTHNGGVNKYSYRTNNFKSITLESDEIGDNRIFSILQSKDDMLWLGTENGLYALDLKTNKISSFKQEHLLKSALISGIVEDSSGILWLGTDKDGLLRLSTNPTKVKQYAFGSNSSQTFSSNDIWEIFLDSKQRIWLCRSGNGIVCFDPATDDYAVYTNNPNDINSISSNANGYIAEDNFGRFWISTPGTGINCFDPKTKKFERYMKSSNTNSLFTNRTTFVMFDKNMQLWIGTEEGLSLMDLEKKKFTHFGEEQGLSVLHIRTILEDNKGDLWIATVNGLFKFNISTKIFTKFTVSDGLPSDQFLPATYKNRKGELFFGTEQGVVFFDPDSITINQNKPEVVITNLKLFNKTVKAGSIIDKSILYEKDLQLNHNENFIAFEFAALDYQNPQQNQYAWYLEGQETEWNKPTLSNIAVYNNLAPGIYTLYAKASNNNNLWSDGKKLLEIHIKPPFYNTWWFKLIIAFLLISIVLILYDLRTANIKRRNIILEKIVEKRTSTIKQQKHELEIANQNLINQKNEIIAQSEKLKNFNKSLQLQQTKIQEQAIRLKELDKIKTQFFTNISHEFRTPLTLIINPLEKMIREAPNDNYRNQIKVLLRNAYRLLRLINQLLDLSSINAGAMKLNIIENNLSNYLKNIAEVFIVQAKRQDIYFQVEISSIMQACFDADKIEKIAFNLLSNALKYTPKGGKIIMEARMEPRKIEQFDKLGMINCLLLIITDTGAGIPKHLHEKIFNRFYKTENNLSGINPGTGIGLSLTKELVKIHYGTIEVNSEIGQGAVFTVIIPIDKRCYQGLEINQSNLQQENILSSLYLSESYFSTTKPILETKEHGSKETPVMLIIEDDEDLNYFLSSHFAGKYNVSQSFNGKAGLDDAFNLIPDIIISDIMMPEKDGYEICSILKEDERTSHIPVILLTAKDTNTEQFEGLEKGADDYIVKPFDLVLLEKRVENLVEQRKNLMERFSRIVTLKPTDIVISKPDENFLDKAMDVIEKNMENTIFNVDIFAQEMGVSRTLLYKKVRALTNQSINDFIRSIRLKRAAQYLQSGSFNITESAIKTGFTNQSYFSKCFEQQFGELPSKYISRYKS